MKIIMCLDDNKGMLFNNRRQSRDKKVIENIMDSLNGEKLYISDFSKNLFNEYESNVVVLPDDEFSLDLKNTGVYFIENRDIAECLEKISEITVYYWNRVYPSDKRCTVDFSILNLYNKEEFEGFSHEKITKAVYKK